MIYQTDKEHDMNARRKFVPQVTCSMPERAVRDLETGVNWWLDERYN